MTVSARHSLDVASNLRVTCVGDVMLDRFIVGEVERISPEAPVPVMRVARESEMLGGAGNVVRNLRALGVSSTLIGVVGHDAAGATVRRLLYAEGAADAIVIDPERPTTEKARFLAQGQQLLRADRESVKPIPAAVERKVQEAAEAAIAPANALILSDYGKGMLTESLAAVLIALGRSRGVVITVDPKGRDFRRYRGANVVTPNRRELERAVGFPVADGAEALAARMLIDECGVESVLVTLGARGMLAVGRDGAVAIEADAREVFDVAGAGDTVAAILTVALAAGADLIEAARLANAAAGVVVGKAGTAIATRAEIDRALLKRDLAGSEDKIFSRAALLEQIERWRRRSLTVGFTNGCFDLIHPGHVALLAHARAACDRLVVGLNSDASVRRLKGPNRPAQRERARAIVLASLTSVDAVVSFEEDTPQALIEAVRPNVLVKGADYRIEEVIGADFVQSYGGRVLLAPLTPGHSTSATLARVARPADATSGGRP